MSDDVVVLVVVVGVLREGVAVTPLLVLITILVFVVKLLMVFVAEDSVTAKLRLPRSWLRSRRSCVCIEMRLFLIMQIQTGSF